jgi:peptide/nickel transport system substrate-binding protein
MFYKDIGGIYFFKEVKNLNNRNKLALTKIQAVLIIAVVAVVAIAGYYFMQPAPPKTQKVLVVACAALGRNPDPAYAFSDLTSFTISMACYDTLVGRGTSKLPDGTEYFDISKVAATGLAESWNVSSDGRVYTFKLRHGIKFQNGNPFNAEAVRYSYNRAINMGFAPGWLLGLCGMNLNSTKVIDDYTVQITVNNPNPFLLTALSYVGIVDPVYVEEHGGVKAGAFNDWMVSHSMGTGPFNLTKYDPSTEAILEANKDYWGGAPKLDKIIIRYVPETSMRELMIKTGEVDVATEIPPKDVADLKNASGVKLEINQMVRIGKITMWWMQAPFNNTKVRQAIAHAIPYDKLIKDVMYNMGTLYYSIVGPDGFGYQPAWNKYDYNLTKAKELLTEAGYPNGFKCTFTIPDSILPDQEMTVVILQSELAKLGIEMEIKKVAAAEFGNLMRAGKLEMFITRWQPAYNDVIYVAYIMHYSKINYLTSGGYNNTAFDKLVEQAMVEADATKRLQLCYDMQRILAEDVACIPTYQYPDITAFRTNIKGFKFLNSGAILYYYLDKV